MAAAGFSNLNLIRLAPSQWGIPSCYPTSPKKPKQEEKEKQRKPVLLSFQPFPSLRTGPQLNPVLVCLPLLPCPQEGRAWHPPGNSGRAGVARSSRKRRRTEGALGDSHSQSLSTLSHSLRISGVQHRHLTNRWWRDCLLPLPHHQHSSLEACPARLKCSALAA